MNGNHGLPWLKVLKHSISGGKDAICIAAKKGICHRPGGICRFCIAKTLF
jgi:hypothetical protein